MEFGGRYRFDASRRAVWEALNDTDKLAAAIPGCRRLEWTGPDTLELELQINLGVAKPTFRADLTLSEVAEAETYTLSGRGRGLLGRAEGAARISLSDAGSGTELHFVATGGADNKIMSLGKALIGKTAQNVIDEFFAEFGGTFAATVTPLQ